MARLLKDWTASESVEQLSESAEVFFTRLIMKADDYGNYVGNVKLIKAALFPLKDSITVAHIERCILECQKAGLLEKYTVDGKDYLHIYGFDQKLRRMKAIYPDPPARTNGGNLRTVDGQARTSADKCPPELEVEVEEETEVELETRVSIWPTFDDFWDKYSKKVDRPKCEKLWKKIEQVAREKIMEHLEMYVRSTPDVQYRKDPATYLRNQSWENQIIQKENVKSSSITKDQRDQYLRQKYGVEGVTNGG